MTNLKAKLSSRQLPWKRQRYRPSVDGIEARHLLSATHGHAHPLQAPSIVGTISGEVVNDKTGLGMSGIRVQLINSVGHVTKTTTTDRSGDYSLGVPSYAVHLNRISGGGSFRARLISAGFADLIWGGPGGFSRFFRG